MKKQVEQEFPLSKTKHFKGTRRLAREKVLQILVAYYIDDDSDLDLLFNHIFFREFNLDEEEVEVDKLLRRDEIYELEADVPIIWKAEDLEFAKTLVNSSISKKDYIDKILVQFSTNWHLDRIAMIDRYLMQQTITELITFGDIPPKVSINECIDIAKKYSTPKSSSFINGVMDSVLDKLKEDGLITKHGRGLIEE